MMLVISDYYCYYNKWICLKFRVVLESIEHLTVKNIKKNNDSIIQVSSQTTTVQTNSQKAVKYFQLSFQGN